MKGVEQFDVPAWRLQPRSCAACATLVAVPTSGTAVTGQTVRMGCPNCHRVAALRPVASDRTRAERERIREATAGSAFGDYQYGDGGKSTGSHDRRPSAGDGDDPDGRDQATLFD